jgi:flagella basal body P-ring formation protein FlgA
VAGASASAGDVQGRAAAHEPPVRIELRSSVQVRRSRVALGEIAGLTTLDLALLRRLDALPIGRVPRSGQAVRLERARLSRWIRAHTGLEPGQIAWAGPESTEVRLEVREVSGEAIVAKAEESLREIVARSGLRAELKVVSAPGPQKLPVGEVELRARPSSPAELLARRASIWVDLSVDGRPLRSLPVDFDLTVFGPGYVAARSQAVGQVLEPGSLEVREVEWTGRDLLPVQAEQGQALRLRRPVEPGVVVTRAHVERAPVVAQGERATLHARQGLVELESRVEVLQDGRSGETVRVKLPSSSSSILARVAGPGKVEVLQ